MDVRNRIIVNPLLALKCDSEDCTLSGSEAALGGGIVQALAVDLDALNVDQQQTLRDRVGESLQRH